MSFKFDFGATDGCTSQQLVGDDASPHEKSENVIKPALQVPLLSCLELSKFPTIDLKLDDGTKLTHVEVGSVSFADSNDDGYITAKQSNSDLIPNVYEGGMKIWECSIDLTMYLCSNRKTFKFSNMKVLELGCGAGLPGIYAYTRGADVTFCDYNEDVLTRLTSPNIFLNTSDVAVAEKHCKLWSGDWSSLQVQLSSSNITFDLILTSETIYSPSSYAKLHDIIKAVLKPGGQVYLAAKTYYFGVGGGTRDFEELVKTRGIFDIEVCKEYHEGVQREILRLQWISSSAG